MMMEFGLVLSQVNTRWEYLISDARAAEEAGLDSVWVIDHLLGPLDPQAPIFEAWTALSAVAASTARVRIGQLVTCAPFRNVGLLAKMATTVDHASGGRLEIGMGAGWFEAEFRAMGYRFTGPRERFEEFAETLEALDLLLRGESVEMEGEYVRLRAALCRPRPVQHPRPPIVVGGAGPRMLRLTGRRADTWNCPVATIPHLERAKETVQGAAGDRRVRTTLQIPAAVGSAEEEAAAALELARMHLAWMGDVESVGLVGTLEQAAERVAEYAARGVDGLICVLPGSPLRPRLIATLGELSRTWGTFRA